MIKIFKERLLRRSCKLQAASQGGFALLPIAAYGSELVRLQLQERVKQISSCLQLAA
jgi:hypothetical protein